MSDLPRYVKIQGSQDLVRDTFSMGVLNTNRHALAAAQRRREQVLKNVRLQEDRAVEINSLRKELSELKALVFKLIETKG